MLSNIKEFADNSETLKEARINVKEMSVVKEIGIYIALIMRITSTSEIVPLPSIST